MDTGGTSRQLLLPGWPSIIISFLELMQALKWAASPQEAITLQGAGLYIVSHSGAEIKKLSDVPHNIPL